MRSIKEELMEEESLDTKQKKHMTLPDRKKLRNLLQYRNMSDEEFGDMFEQKKMGIESTKDFEDRIARKIKEAFSDYDLTDLNSNDKLTLRAIALAYTELDDYSVMIYNLRKEGLDDNNLSIVEKVSRIMNDLRGSISSMSNDLKITRKVRKSDKEQSVISYIEDLKKKAKEFYESKMQLVFCPKCNTWIASVWALYPEDPHNKLTVVCNRELEDGHRCGEKITISTADLLKLGGTNKADVPDSIK